MCMKYEIKRNCILVINLYTFRAQSLGAHDKNRLILGEAPGKDDAPSSGDVL